MSKNSKCHWIKLYVEMLDDPKVGLLPDAVKWRWTSVLLLAGEMNEDGFLPDVNDMAWRLHTNVETLQGEMRMLPAAGWWNCDCTSRMTSAGSYPPLPRARRPHPAPNAHA